MKFLLQNTRRVVLKVGTGILTAGIGQLDTARIHAICREVAALRRQGVEVVLVSSGAIALGMGRLGLHKRPADLADLQTCAAVGQARLIQTWQTGFEPAGIHVAQILYTRDDLRGRRRHVAARQMLENVLARGILPIVNENDSISAEEIQFGDNDVLSALVASLTRADALLILSKAPGLIDLEGSGKVVPVVTAFTPEILGMARGTADPTGRGGMVTKLEAARIANQSGSAVFIGSGEDPAILSRLFAGESVGTVFIPNKLPMQARKRWIAFFQKPGGRIIVDAGASEALQTGGKSLLARGLREVRGEFPADAVIEVANTDERPFARGICHFSSSELRAMAGRGREELQALFPDRKRLEVIHRDDLVLL